jgi:hypothetical protein
VKEMLGEQTKIFSVCLPYDLADKVNRYYRKLRISKSQQLRYIIDYFFSLPPEKREEILIQGFEQEIGDKPCA